MNVKLLLVWLALLALCALWWSWVVCMIARAFHA